LLRMLGSSSSAENLRGSTLSESKIFDFVKKEVFLAPKILDNYKLLPALSTGREANTNGDRRCRITASPTCTCRVAADRFYCRFRRLVRHEWRRRIPRENRWNIDVLASPFFVASERVHVKTEIQIRGLCAQPTTMPLPVNDPFIEAIAERLAPVPDTPSECEQASEDQLRTSCALAEPAPPARRLIE